VWAQYNKSGPDTPSSKNADTLIKNVDSSLAQIHKLMQSDDIDMDSEKVKAAIASAAAGLKQMESIENLPPEAAAYLQSAAGSIQAYIDLLNAKSETGKAKDTNTPTGGVTWNPAGSEMGQFKAHSNAPYAPNQITQTLLGIPQFMRP